jgi:hypothetical protein
MSLILVWDIKAKARSRDCADAEWFEFARTTSMLSMM